MSQRVRNAIVAQSGGPTVAINASLAGVIAKAANSADIGKIYGAVNGVEGLLKKKIVDLSEKPGTDKAMLEQLKKTPSMYLGSCRHKLSAENGEIDKVFEILEEYDIGYFFYIGGNDSMDTIKQLSEQAAKRGSDILFMGIPKTIDNDLTVTDHTPGFGSAAKYIATSVLEMAHDTYIYDTKSVLIVEMMGRDAGWLTAASALARNSYSAAPHLIYLPETAFSDEEFLEDVKECLTHRKQVVVAVSEGIRYADGSYVSANSRALDQFGHVELCGAGKFLEKLVKNNLKCKVRSVEVNVLQRCASHCLSIVDIDEGYRLGEMAVQGVLRGMTGKMVVLTRVSNEPYEIKYEYADVDKVANLAKPIPREWINEKGNDVTEDLISYVRPLIDEMPKYLFL